MSSPVVVMTQENHSALIFPRGYLGDLFDAYRKACEGSKYDRSRKLSIAPLSVVPTILQRLRDIGLAIDVSPELVQALQETTAQQWVDLQSAKERAHAVDKEIQRLRPGKAIRPYQLDGISWLAPRSAAVLADDMGVGKTLQTLAAVPPRTPILVICPANAKGVWRREAAMWRPNLDVVTVEGRDNFRWPEPGQIVIMNYDILPKGHKKECEDKFCLGCAAFLEKAPKGLTVIGDEAHMLKSAKAQRTRAFRALAERARKVGGRSWLLTATPLLNRPPELWNVFQCAGVAQIAFQNSATFKELFSARQDRFGATQWGAPSDEVASRIQKVMLRRTKVDVAKDLPRKSYKILDVAIDKKTIALLDEVLKEIGSTSEEIEALVESGRVLKFEQISAVRAALATAKIPAMLDRVQDYEDAEEPLVVFSVHRAPIDALRNREGWKVITGDTVKPGERQGIEEAFQRGELKGVGCTIQAGGVAITLTRACNALMVDEMWTPGLNQQAEDRILRIGQERPVLIEKLVASHPLDERVALLLTRKAELVEATVEAARQQGSLEQQTMQTDLSFGRAYPPDYILCPYPDRKTDLSDLRSNISTSSVEEELKARQATVEAVGAEQEKLKDELQRQEIERKQKFHGPRTPQEEWAASALRMLDDLDPDRAREQNGAGFNKIDGGLGSSLRRQLDERGLSDTQWRVLFTLLRKYHRQVGRIPGEGE